MHWFAVLLVLTSLIYLVSASGSCLQENEVEKRQALAMSSLTVPLPTTSSTSSFNYWWPFPPTYTTDSLSTPIETESDGSDQAEDPEQSVTDAVSPVGSVVISSSPTSTLVTTFDETSFQSSASSTSQTTITALPPLTSPLHQPHRVSTYPQPISPIFFTPLLGIVGLGVGLILGWFGYGYWKRKQQARGEQHLGGPEYVGIKDADLDNDEKYSGGVDKVSLRESEAVWIGELLLGQPHLHKNEGYTSEGRNDLNHSMDHQACTSARPHVGLSVLQRSPLLSGFLGGHLRCAETEGYDKNSDSAESYPIKNIRSPDAPTLFSSVTSSDEDDEDYDAARLSSTRRDTVNRKSIRRRLVEKLRLPFTPGRSLPFRKSRGQRNIRETTPELEEGVLLQDDSLVAGTPEKKSQLLNKTRRPGSILGHGRAISDFSVQPDDFQVPHKVYALKDPGVSTPTRHASQANGSFGTPFQSRSRMSMADKFTPLPPRKARSAHKLVSARSTRRRTEIMDDFDGSPKLKMPAAVDRRVLPTSPPLLSSPELQSALFFGPGVSLPRCPVELPSTELRGRHEYWTPSGALESNPSRGFPMRRAPLGPRQSKKLISQHLPAIGMDALVTESPSLGPVMSSAPLRRSTARVSSLSPRKGGYSERAVNRSRGRASTLPSAPMSPKERYEARHTAMEKVEAIVERSWSARLLQGGPEL